MVYIVIVNWNGWKDTIECLESVFRSDYADYRVIVCDNASEDGSVERIVEWAEGRLPYVVYDLEQAEAGGCSDDSHARIIIINTGANLGFAGGNNAGMKYALAKDDFEYIWLLNNDTVVEADALSRLVERMAEKPDAGMCGGTLLYYHDKSLTQTLGGTAYNKWFGTIKHICHMQPAGRPVDPDEVERKMDYVCGACMLVRKSFIQNIGLMNEDYFLYFEELDWAVRSRKRYELAYAPKCIVYHKEGNSTGSGVESQAKSETSDFYNIRNRIVFTRKFFPEALPTVYLGLAFAVINRIRRGQWDRARMILKLWTSA